MKKIIISKKYLKEAQLEETKPAMEGLLYTPETEDDFVSQDRGRLSRKSKPKMTINPNMSDDEWIRLLDDQAKQEEQRGDVLWDIFTDKMKRTQASSKSIIICKK